jgi:sugar phosphate isomerase/epimerase
MFPHTRAMVAAAAHAFIVGKKVAGVYDHAAGRHVRIAAECRGEHLQGFDGDRQVKFGGTLPELYDSGDRIFVTLEIDGTKARGYDRGSSSAYTAEVTERVVQLYDHGQSAWFAFDVQVV